MKITPLFDRVLIKEEEQNLTTTTGFILSGTSQESVVVAQVLSVGTGNEKEDGSSSKIFVSPNDKIICSKFAVTKFKLDGEEYGIIRQSDVLAIIK